MYSYTWKCVEDGLKKLEGGPKHTKIYCKSQGSWQIKAFYSLEEFNLLVIYKKYSQLAIKFSENFQMKLENIT